MSEKIVSQAPLSLKKGNKEQRKVLLSLKNVTVKFNVRGRILTAIRNVSLDVYEHESLAIVGESGSGKSVLTKTFAGMLENNGFIPEGSIILDDEELSKTDVRMTPYNRRLNDFLLKKLSKYSLLERGAEETVCRPYAPEILVHRVRRTIELGRLRSVVEEAGRRRG